MVAPASLPTLELTILRRGCFVFLPQLGSTLRRIVVSVLNSERCMSISEGHYIVEQSVIKIITNPKYFSNTEQDEHTFSVEYNRDDILLNRPFPEMFIENINKTAFKVEDTYNIQYYSVFNDILTGDTSKWRNKDLRIANITSSEISDEIKVNPFRLMSSKHKKKSIEAFSERYMFVFRKRVGY